MEWEYVPYAEVPLYYHTKTPISFTVLCFPGDRWYCGPLNMCRPSSLYFAFSMLLFQPSYPQALLFHFALYLLPPFILFHHFTAVFPAPLSVAIYSTFLVFLIWLCCSPLTLNQSASTSIFICPFSSWCTGISRLHVALSNIIPCC